MPTVRHRLALRRFRFIIFHFFRSRLEEIEERGVRFSRVVDGPELVEGVQRIPQLNAKWRASRESWIYPPASLLLVEPSFAALLSMIARPHARQ
jgi:hypothetical protein